MHPKTDAARARRAPLGLRSRLVLSLSILMLLILAGSSAIDFHIAEEMADQAQDQTLADSAFDLESHLKTQDSTQPMDLGEEAKAILRSNAPDVLFYAVRRASGHVLMGDADLPAYALPAASGQLSFADAVYRGQAVRATSLRAALAAEDVVITVAQTTRRREQARRHILAAMVLPNLAVIGATLLAVLFGVRQGLLPLKAVESDIARRSATDLREFDLATAPVEVQPMLRRLNELFVLLQRASHQQQRFIADAAHQLKTPLAGLQNQIDLAMGGGGLADRDREWLGRVEEATSRLGHLLNQLLAFARAEASNPAAVGRERVALDQLVEESATEFLDAALAKDIDLGFDIAPAAVRGERWMLKEALSNLVDNAIRYSPQGGIVTVHCGSDHGGPFVEVQDSGPGIDEAHRQRVFERFYRIPGTVGEGCGLGLPIVREIAQLHGAEIHLQGVMPSGLRVRVSFPAR